MGEIVASGRKRRTQRPWWLTYVGGVVLSTFSKRDRAIRRGRKLKEDRKATHLWVHRRGSDVWEEVA